MIPQVSERSSERVTTAGSAAAANGPALHVLGVAVALRSPRESDFAAEGGEHPGRDLGRPQRTNADDGRVCGRLALRVGKRNTTATSRPRTHLHCPPTCGIMNQGIVGPTGWLTVGVFTCPERLVEPGASVECQAHPPFPDVPVNLSVVTHLVVPPARHWVVLARGVDAGPPFHGVLRRPQVVRAANAR
jgi:hypothetical protein